LPHHEKLLVEVKDEKDDRRAFTLVEILNKNNSQSFRSKKIRNDNHHHKRSEEEDSEKKISKNHSMRRLISAQLLTLLTKHITDKIGTEEGKI
jgi:hypothetical protein